MKKTLRAIHRWTGLLIFAFVIFYALTGIVLNHRQAFGLFVDRQHSSSPAPALNGEKVAKALAAYEAATGEVKRPTVVRVRPNGTIELLYGSHGVVTYVFKPGGTRMERIEKKKVQPLHWLNRLHKAAKTSRLWIAVADSAAILILIATISALFIFRFRRLDWLLLIAGTMLLLFTVTMG